MICAMNHFEYDKYDEEKKMLNFFADLKLAKLDKVRQGCCCYELFDI